jgi:2-aminoadipate transaminase
MAMEPAIPLSQAARRTRDSAISDLMARALAAPDLVSLAAGFVDQATLPDGEALKAVESILSDEVEGRRALQYGTTRGDLDLRRRLVGLLEKSDGKPPGTFEGVLDRVVVTSGSQQLLYLLAEVLLDPGDIVLVEAPTYFVFMGVLNARGATILGVETDQGGLKIDALDALLSDLDRQGRLDRVKFLYTITEHSNPTGLSLREDRRQPLIDTVRRWSRDHRIFILEDSAYRGLTYTGPEPPSVWGLDDSGETVILARTFSKTFSPGLKIGYGVLPQPLVGPVLNLKGNHDFGSTHFSQRVLEKVLSLGLYQPHVGRLVDTYRSKRDALLSALDRHLRPFGDSVSWTRPNGGLYVWLTLPEDIDTGLDGSFCKRCLDEGVLYVPGSLSYPDGPGDYPRNQARLSFGVATESAIDAGVRRLARALEADVRSPHATRERSAIHAG